MTSSSVLDPRHYPGESYMPDIYIEWLAVEEEGLSELINRTVKAMQLINPDEDEINIVKRNGNEIFRIIKKGMGVFNTFKGKYIYENATKHLTRTECGKLEVLPTFMRVLLGDEAYNDYMRCLREDRWAETNDLAPGLQYRVFNNYKELVPA